MRQTITGVVAAMAVLAASAVPALACGGQSYVSPCGEPQVYVAPTQTYSSCDSGCGGWARHERLAEPTTQYYYANQGPTYSGPGAYAPYPTYREDTVSGWSGYGYRPHRYRYDGGYRGYSHYRPHRDYGYSARPSLRYGYAPRHGYGPRFYAPHRSMRYGMPMGMPRAYGYHERMMREHTLRRYY